MAGVNGTCYAPNTCEGREARQSSADTYCKKANTTFTDGVQGYAVSHSSEFSEYKKFSLDEYAEHLGTFVVMGMPAVYLASKAALGANKLFDTLSMNLAKYWSTTKPALK